jgi:alpha-D-ribose 1-methylphosphonate 5-triphosphate synthase subunit PhnH
MSIDRPGFADPVRDAQSVFRAVLGAMSRPGRLFRAGELLTPPAPLAPATAAVLLTLVDAETPVQLAPDLAAAAEWVAFHCGAAVTETSSPFIVATAMPPLDTLDGGTDEAPQNSATLIVQIAALGEGTAYLLSGPGLKAPAILRASGLPDDFVSAWAANHALFPRGVDLILCAGDTLTALPRTATVTVTLGEG